MSEDGDECDPLGAAPASAAPSRFDYDVGYRKPPLHRRFVKGKSGNPKGAPKQVVNLLSSFNAMLHETDMTINGGRVVSKSEAMVHTLVAEAGKCNQKAFAKFLRLLKRAGLLEPPPAPPRDAVRTARAGFEDMAAFKAGFGKPLPTDTRH